MPRLELADIIKSKVLDENKWLLGINEVSDLVAEHTKPTANKIIKAVYLVYDSHSPYRELGLSLRQVQESVMKRIIPNSGLEWEAMESFSNFWIEYMCTDSEKALVVVKREMDRLDEFLKKDTKLSLDTAGDRVKLVKGYKELQEQYLELKKKVRLEEQVSGSKRKKQFQPISFLEKKGMKNKK